MLAVNPRPLASLQFFQRMMHDIMTGGQTSDPIDQVRDPSRGIYTDSSNCLPCSRREIGLATSSSSA